MLYSMFYDEEARRNVVSEAPAYQVLGLDKFIKSLPPTVNHKMNNSLGYIFDSDNIEIYNGACAGVGCSSTSIIFSINTFNNYKKMSLQGMYDDFYELNCNRKTYILSYNKDKLFGYCGSVNRWFCRWVNRLTTT